MVIAASDSPSVSRAPPVERTVCISPVGNRSRPAAGIGHRDRQGSGLFALSDSMRNEEPWPTSRTHHRGSHPDGRLVAGPDVEANRVRALVRPEQAPAGGRRAAGRLAMLPWSAGLRRHDWPNSSCIHRGARCCGGLRRAPGRSAAHRKSICPARRSGPQTTPCSAPGGSYRRGRRAGRSSCCTGKPTTAPRCSGSRNCCCGERYRVLAPDARAHGTSGGGFATYGGLERDDLRAWGGWARADSLPTSACSAAGASMGAAILIQTLPDVAVLRGRRRLLVRRLCPSLARWRIGTALHLPPGAPRHGGRADRRGRRCGTRAWRTACRSPRRARSAAGAARACRCSSSTAPPTARSRRRRARAGRREPAVGHAWLVNGAAHTQAWAAAPREYPARVLGFLAAHQ